MQGATIAVAMLRVDGARLARDRFLLDVAAWIVAISLAMRWAVPRVTLGVQARWSFDLQPYHALLMSHVLVQLTAQLAGIVGAFLLLDSREDGTAKALLVSPTGLGAYVVVSGAAMAAASGVLTVVEGAIVGLALPSWPALIAAGVAGGSSAPLFALVVAGLADDKTQAFAYLKILGILPLFASGAWFVAEPLQWLAGVYPPYWAVKAYWVAEAGGASWPLCVACGVAVTAVWLLPAARLYLRAARR